MFLKNIQTGYNCVLFSGVDFKSERIATLLSGRIFWLSWENPMGFYARKPDFVACEQQRCRLACASPQSDQHLCQVREPLYSNSAVIMWWLRLRSAQNSVSSCYKGQYFGQYFTSKNIHHQLLSLLRGAFVKFLAWSFISVTDFQT